MNCSPLRWRLDIGYSVSDERELEVIVLVVMASGCVGGMNKPVGSADILFRSY